MLRVGGLAALVAAGTAAVGWWTVPLLAALWVQVVPRLRHPVRTCVLGGALGWALLLGWTALHGPVGVVAQRVGGVLRLPGWGLILVTLLFPAVLAGAAARAMQPPPPR
jgi:hypothetical protein